MRRNGENRGKIDIWSVLIVIFWVLVIGSIVYTLATGTIGLIIYKKYGDFPYHSDDVLKVLMHGFDRVTLKTKDAMNYMTKGTGGVAAVMFLVNFLIANAFQFKDERFREILFIVSFAVFAVLMILYEKDFFASKYDLVVGLVVVALIVLMFFCFKDTDAGLMLLISGGALLGHVFVVPLIMSLFTMSIQKVIVFLVLAVLAVMCLVDTSNISFSGSSGGSSGGSLGGSTRSDSSGKSTSLQDREKSKMESEIKALDDRIKASQKGLVEHQKGSWSYMHVDEKVTKAQIDKDLEKKRALEEELNKSRGN